MTYRKTAGAVALLTSAALGVAVPSAASAAPASPCGTQAMVKETLPNGTTWRLCWRIHDKAGLILDQVFLSTKRNPEPVQVLDSIRLAQLHVPYDTGDMEFDDLTDLGMGGGFLETLTGDDCKGGSARVGSDGSEQPQQRKVLCVSAEPSGLAYRAREEAWDDNGPQPGKLDSKQGHDLVLRTISKLAWYEYVTEYRLHDDGQISARLGATGDLAPSSEADANRGWPIGTGDKYYSTMHYHNAFWRVDFNIAGKGGEKVEQYDTALDGRGEVTAKLKTTRTAIAKEGNFSKVNQRWWRMTSPNSKNADGHQRSYELVTGGDDRYEGHPETKPDVTFTQKNPCEKYASDNAVDPECPANSKTVIDFAKNKENLSDPVMWVRVGFHHVPRDEDQSPMPMHWQGFDLVPRDFTAMNQLTPDGRTGLNGDPQPDPGPSGAQG
ncbi:primary-amine oxidase [Actinoplanes sp. NEAU-A12]|uniref:Amine oxidase n=1 Tax=Actinoplanes sandaracinus TaxID=3045177 RepID=A0ABT6WEJ4_9ACTN|nr:primary-amine oxidase [Actinoplanes sandaracinus]MDI6098156.1 primary-amine oxidase [Actinoplanes sandaracinus]